MTNHYVYGQNCNIEYVVPNNGYILVALNDHDNYTIFFYKLLIIQIQILFYNFFFLFFSFFSTFLFYTKWKGTRIKINLLKLKGIYYNLNVKHIFKVIYLKFFISLIKNIIYQIKKKLID